MLEIFIPEQENYDPVTNEFTLIKSHTLHLEHSLISVSKWEARHHVAFLTKREKSPEETIDYVRCMTLDKNVDDKVYYNLTDEDYKKIADYINDPMSATCISKVDDKKSSGDTMTSELIYYYMIEGHVPVEFQKWHLNRLITLINVIGIKNNPKKMSKADLLKRNTALNAARKKRLGTKG